MKNRKTMKYKLAELSYKNPKLERKINLIEKSFQEVKKIINEK